MLICFMENRNNLILEQKVCEKKKKQLNFVIPNKSDIQLICNHSYKNRFVE